MNSLVPRPPPFCSSVCVQHNTCGNNESKDDIIQAISLSPGPSVLQVTESWAASAIIMLMAVKLKSWLNLASFPGHPHVAWE